MSDGETCALIKAEKRGPSAFGPRRLCARLAPLRHLKVARLSHHDIILNWHDRKYAPPSGSSTSPKPLESFMSLWKLLRRITYTRSPTSVIVRKYGSVPDLPKASTNNHNDLESFLQYAADTGLSPSSSVYTGTHYEYTAQRTLRDHAFVLQRLGQRNDYGIDLAGFWHIPTLPEPLRVIVQCKNSVRKLMPKIVRELEGGFTGAPPGWRADGVLGALVSPLAATKGVREGMSRSFYPMLWFTMKSSGTDDGLGSVKQILWNRPAADLGLEGLSVVVQHSSEPLDQHDVGLVWEGKPIGASNIRHGGEAAV